MSETKNRIGWDEVEEACKTAKAIAWDGCHKIYLAMDEYQEEWFLGNYDYVLKGVPDALFDTIKHWYERSCGLRFVQAVSTNEENPNEGFINLIPQCYDPDKKEWN